MLKETTIIQQVQQAEQNKGMDGMDSWPHEMTRVCPYCTYILSMFQEQKLRLWREIYSVGSCPLSPFSRHWCSIHWEDTGNEQRQPEINLKGYLVGNPITGSKFDDFNSKIPYPHGVGIISDQLYEAAMTNCEGDYVSPKNKMCAGVVNTIQKLISEVDEGYILGDRCVRAAPKSVKDDASRSRFLSEEQIQTRDALRIKKGTIGKWVRCIKGLPYTYDVPISIGYQFNLTTRGYRALVLSRDHDLSLPFLGTQAWIRSLNFSIVDDWRAWHVDGQSAGSYIKAYKGLNATP